MSPEELTEAERRMRPDFVATVPRSKPMTHEQAGGSQSNPRYKDPDAEEKGYWNNCQSCVISYAMRLRGYDVEAKNMDCENEAQEQLSKDSTLAWIDPESGEQPRLRSIPDTVRKASKGLEWLKTNLETGGVYTFQFRFRYNNRNGHIIILRKDGESLTIYDPQTSELINKSKQIEYLLSIDWKSRSRPKVLRIDTLEPNLTIVNAVLKAKVKENDTD